MGRPIQTVTSIDRLAYSDIIDVRSPGEYAEDHVPGSKNLYVLDDSQRREVGTVYKQINAFEANKLGVSLVAENISHWMAKELRDKPKDYRPLVYCWRGGQRSMSLATVLAAIGWEVSIIEGGYKRYRQQVRETLNQVFSRQPTIILTGLTGTRKTDLLHLLEQRGEQVLDLEGLANHRGSLLGSHPGSRQPAQKYFESLLADKTRNLDPGRTLWIEAESNKIGNLYCPLPLWSAMQEAPQVEINAPLEARVSYLNRAYQEITEDPGSLKQKLGLLRERHSKARIEQWQEYIDQLRWDGLIRDLLVTHYDPAYTRSMARNNRKQLETIALESLKSIDLDEAASRLQELSRNIEYLSEREEC